MSQPSFLLKSSAATTQPTLDSSFAISSQLGNGVTTPVSSRSRAGSIIRSMVPSSSPSPSRRPSSATQNMMAKRASTVSEALHLKLSALAMQDDMPSSPYDNLTPQPSPFPSGLNASTTSLSQVSESNWANNYADFDIKEPIGYGSSAIVYGAIYLPMKKMVALKMIDLDMFERNQIDELRRETALMALSKHPNVLKVYGSFVNGSKLYIITPYLSYGSCLDIMKTSFREGFEEFTIASILKQALEGLVYLHKNGHIHRDVKAGNLLMDDQGSVLLADFGVSSSLSDKGDVRKTFVGTPCWMAPEVMEQAGYDFKADIWSFGITAIELASGHAPYARYPPLKVLKLTLSNAPPTLDTVHTKHKYSRAFKEMIEWCLQKDPVARPSAEKLLQHPFFKQAKKKEYLCRSVLSHVSPIDERPHKKLPQKLVMYEQTDQWDFDDTPDEKTMNLPQDIKASTAPGTEESVTPPPAPKRHITFGDVVVRESYSSSNNEKNVVSTYSRSPSVDIPVSVHPNFLPESNPTTVTKKSRFIVEESEHIPSTTTTTTTSIMLHGGSSASPNDNVDYIGTNPAKNHRYSIQMSTADYDRHPDSILTASSRHYTMQTDSPSSPLSRVASCENFCERKSRFEIQHSSSNSTTTSFSNIDHHLPTNISRESSYSSLPQPQKLGRFSVEKSTGEGNNNNNSNNNTVSSKDDSRKIGRFELTGRSASSSPSDTGVSFGPLDATTSRERTHHVDLQALYPQMEILLKQADAQKAMLQEMMTQLNQTSTSSITSSSIARSRTVSMSEGAKRHLDPNTPLDQTRTSTGLAEAVDQLQQLLTSSMYERDRLLKENDSLRREVELLRQSSSKASSS